ncbi:DUF859 domain-containing protein [Streptococcus sp. VEG1o]|uniref:DUF859 domain-containing protein n=1 Tax=Streptococcus sp. VEG1o TaxID=3097368 RepID=UPI00397D909F
MAEFWSNNDRGYHIRLWIDQVSQSISGNSSQVRVRLALLNTTTTFSGYNCSAYVDFDGGRRLNWSGSPSVLSYNQTVWLIDQTVTVGHNADGTKTFGLMANFSGSGGWSPGNLTIGGNSFTLTTIPRSSSVSVSSGVIGSAVTININRQSSSFKHTVRYAWGNKQGTIASNVDTSTTWTIPLDFANIIPNSTSGTGTIYVDTYSGGTKTGTQSTTFTASVPASMKPTFSGVSLSDFNTAAQNLISGNTFIQIISNIKVMFNGGTGSYGSTITGYKAEIVGKNQTTNMNGGTLGVMNYSGSITVRATVCDSRGRWSDTKSVAVTVLEYFAPSLSFSIARTGSTSSTLTVTRNARVAPLTVGGVQKNTMALSFKVARIGTTAYTADNGAAAGSWTSLSSLINSQANLSGTYAANQSFVVIGILEDKFTRTEFAVNVATESVVFSYDRYGVGVNKIRERGALDVSGSIFANNKSIQQHALTTGNPETGLIGRQVLDDVRETSFGWGLIKKFMSYISTFGLVKTYYTSDKEAVQIWTAHDCRRSFGRYRDYQTGVWGDFAAVGIDNFYPVGTIFHSTDSTNPTTHMGRNWQKMSNTNIDGVTVYRWRRIG